MRVNAHSSFTWAMKERRSKNIYGDRSNGRWTRMDNAKMSAYNNIRTLQKSQSEKKQNSFRCERWATLEGKKIIFFFEFYCWTVEFLMRPLNIQWATSLDERNEQKQATHTHTHDRGAPQRWPNTHNSWARMLCCVAAVWCGDPVALRLHKHNIFVCCLFSLKTTSRWNERDFGSERVAVGCVISVLLKLCVRRPGTRSEKLVSTVNALHSVCLSFSSCRRIPNDIIDSTHFDSTQEMKWKNTSYFCRLRFFFKWQIDDINHMPHSCSIPNGKYSFCAIIADHRYIEWILMTSSMRNSSPPQRLPNSSTAQRCDVIWHEFGRSISSSPSSKRVDLPFEHYGKCEADNESMAIDVIFWNVNNHRTVIEYTLQIPFAPIFQNIRSSYIRT